jgi:hypothetical protein
MAQVHLGLLQRPATLLEIALGAGGHQIVPGVFAAEMARDHVIQRQMTSLNATVLTGIVIPPKDLPFAEPDARPRAFDHVF